MMLLGLHLIELMQAWVRWIDTHMESIHVSRIEKGKNNSKSIRLMQNDLSFWFISNSSVVGEPFLGLIKNYLQRAY